MKLMTINEAAPMLDMSAQKLRREIKAGRYPYVPIGGRTLVDIDELREIIRSEGGTINIKEAAELTGLPASAIRRGAKAGWLPHTMTGNQYRFKPGEIIDALQSMKTRY